MNKTHMDNHPAQSLSDDQVTESLLHHNYFPNHNFDHSELPPQFSTKNISVDLMNQILEANPESRNEKADGFDGVSYHLTRFNLLKRKLGIPHPLAQFRVIKLIHDHWKEIAPLIESENAQFPIRQHEDGRVSSMRYERPKKNQHRPPGPDSWNDIHSEKSQGAKYKVVTDIANCYPSIYTHAMPWAALGKPQAKIDRYTGWANHLDAAIRRSKRNETMGIWTGPATSTIFAEIILCKVDNEMERDHIRYLDDYIYYAETLDEAESFLHELSGLLAEYGLELNPSKTSISKLPTPLRPLWLRELYRNRPQTADIQEVLDYFDDALEVSEANLQESSVKFALNQILENRPMSSMFGLYLPRLVSLAADFPNISAGLFRLVPPTAKTNTSVDKGLNYAIRKCALNGHSDGVCWLLEVGKKLNVELEHETISCITEKVDNFMWVSLFNYGADAAIAIIEVSKELETDYMSVDKNWLIHYELFAAGLIENPYENSEETSGRHRTFEMLKNAHVSFYKS